MKKFRCANCCNSSTEKEWRETTKEYLGQSPYVEKNIGNLDKEFCCPKCHEVIDGMGIQEDKPRRVRCCNCKQDFNEEELLKEELPQLDNYREICPNCGKDVFYDLKEINGEVVTFATRV